MTWLTASPSSRDTHGLYQRRVSGALFLLSSSLFHRLKPHIRLSRIAHFTAASHNTHTLCPWTEDLHDLYVSPNIKMIKSRIMKWAGHVARMGNPERGRQLRRLRLGWEDNIKMGLKEIGWEEVDWINLVQSGDKWPNLANTDWTFKFRKMQRIFY